MDNSSTDDEGKGEELENEIEVNVHISDSADTLQNRFSVVVLDIKEENEGAPKEGASQNGCEHARNLKDADSVTAASKEKEENFDEICLEEKDDGKERSNGEKASKNRDRKRTNSEVELEVWRKGIRLSLVTFIYVSYSILGCIHVLSVLIYILVGLSRETREADPEKTGKVRPALILITFMVLFLLFVTVWAIFQLRQTLHRQWFVRSLWISWITSALSILYIVVVIVMSSASATTGFTIFLFCCVVGSACAISFMSVVAALHFSAASLIDCPTSTCASYLPTLGKVKLHDHTWRTKGKTEPDKDAPPWEDAFNFRTAYLWSIVLFVFSCISIPIGGATAIHPCSVFRFFAFSFVVLIIPSIITGIVNHVQEKKLRILWLAFLWMSVLGLLITTVRIAAIAIEIARGGSCQTWYKVLNVCLLLLVLGKILCLVIMIKTAVNPLRNSESTKDASVNEQHCQ